uniref:hypothetical protein n=1 Tax=Micromonospora sp. NBRC 110009 TaxID=3061627 RepID=UPI0034A0ADE1
MDGVLSRVYRLPLTAPTIVTFGGVRSTLMSVTSASRVLPALSTAVRLIIWRAPSLLICRSAGQVAMPDRESVQV